MATFVVCHGAWSAGWAWKRMHPLMRDAGHRLVVPTYTGLGERAHLAHVGIDLDTHIADVVNVVEFEDLREIVLVGHSYGGMVATGVADRIPERIAKLVYLDAFVPADGQCLLDLQPPSARERMLDAAKTKGEGWRVPSNPIPPDTAPEDIAWILPRRVAQPIRTFEQPLVLARGETSLPRAYIYCTRTAPGDVFGSFAARARSDARWRYHEIDASHSPAITAPRELAALLSRVAGE